MPASPPLPPSVQRTYSVLATAIAAFMNRDASVFVINSVDLLKLAINNAKDYCQRAVVFEYARTQATVHGVDLVNGGSLLTAVRYGSLDLIAIRNIERVYLAWSNGTSQFPIGFMSRDSYSRRLQKRYENVISTNPTQTTLDTIAQQCPFACTQVGQSFYISPSNASAFGGASTIDVHFDVVEWLPDFAFDTQTSFLLDFAFQFLLLRSMVELNFYLKEDQRVQISSSALSDSWNNVVQWNATIIGLNVDDANLD